MECHVQKCANQDAKCMFPQLCIIWTAPWENVPSQSGMRAQRRLKSACASTQSDQSSLSARRNFVSLAIQNVPSEDFDQTARMRRLIWIFAQRTFPKVVFGRFGSDGLYKLGTFSDIAVHIYNRMFIVSRDGLFLLPYDYGAILFYPISMRKRTLKIFTTLWANSADDKCDIFLIRSRK